MPILSIDIETYSDVDLSKCGVYAYSDSPNFEILLFSYAFDEEPTQIVDLACGERLPERVLAALEDPAITKAAFNAQFERTCISKYLGRRLAPFGWQCTAVQSAMLALPLSLDSVGEVLNIQRKKLKEGADLVRFFSMPCKPTKSNGGRTRNRPEDAPEKWERFKTYCIRDVDAEREIRQKLWKFPIPEPEMELYQMDQEINDRGILVDQQLVENAVLCDNQYREMVTARAYELTGLSNPNSPVQIKGWLAEHGVEAEKLDKKTVKGLLTETDGEVLEVLKLRLLMAKTSVKKYEAIERSVCSDGRVHGLLQFYGANRTGRWAGRLVQVQNLPQNHIPDLDLARSLVKKQRFEDLDLLYESTPEVLSELIRTAFVPKPGCRFIVADFSAIEARVLAWFAGEQWRLHTFAEGGDIYCASASKMFGVPVVKHGVNGHLRQLWDKAQEARKKKRDYLDMDCQIREVTEENYPYKGHLFCAKCGSPLTHRIYSNGNRMSWDCSGRRRHGKEFCDGIHVPDTAVRQWKFEGNIYISVKDSRKSIKEFSYTKESSWSRRHKKKEFVRDVPELTEENYPYYRSIFCAECGSRLVRHIKKHGDIVWECNGRKRKGAAYCEGVRIPDRVVQAFMPIRKAIYIKERKGRNGTKHYSYSCKKPERVTREEQD